MQNLVIDVSWEWTLGIVGILIAGAWYASRRFTALETSMEWVKEVLRDLKISSDNAATPAFGTHSPVNLNQTGEEWIVESGLKEYIENNKDYFLKECQEEKNKNPYEVQKRAFRLLDEVAFDPALEVRLKKERPWE
jgi:hypothetical protein